MPLYHFVCTICSKPVRRLFTRQQALSEYSCPDVECTGFLKRRPKPPTATVVESLDNGLMPRRLERLADAERLYKERAKQDTNKE